jgi:hypothetical protein
MDTFIKNIQVVKIISQMSNTASYASIKTCQRHLTTATLILTLQTSGSFDIAGKDNIVAHIDQHGGSCIGRNQYLILGRQRACGASIRLTPLRSDGWCHCNLCEDGQALTVRN